MLAESRIIQDLMDLMPLDGSNGPVLALFGDLAYPLTPWSLKGFVNPAANSPQAHFNTRMNSARVSVEWGFKNILQLYTFLDFHQQQQILKMPIGRYFIVAAFLTNLHTAKYGNQISRYFGFRLGDPDHDGLREYLNMID